MLSGPESGLSMQQSVSSIDWRKEKKLSEYGRHQNKIPLHNKFALHPQPNSLFHLQGLCHSEALTSKIEISVNF